MKKANLISLTKSLLLLLLLTSVLLVFAACGEGQYAIAVEGELADGATIEYTGGKIQFPVASVADQQGKIVSYDVLYKVIDQADQSEMTDEYAAFELKPGAYRIEYTYGADANVNKSVSFTVVDTTAPIVEFLEIPNGLFLQDITEDTVNKLPLYSMEDASSGAGIDLKQTLKFKGAGDTEFKEYPFRQINNSYEITAFGTFAYELTATDCYGNTTTVNCQWNVKDRTWKPAQELPEGILADYSEEGYRNLVEGGDVNQYYKIDRDYSDTYLPEFEGAKGVLKIDMGFNNAAGYGNNTIRLRLPKTFTKEDLEGKYLAVRLYVEGEHLRENFLFGGNNVAFRDADATTRAFTADMSGLQTGKWMTVYLGADAVENIGVYPNAVYNPQTTFYEGGDPADCVQLCFHREAGYFNDMTLYVDSVSIAEVLPDTELTIDGDRASWTAVEGAAGYRVVLNGEEDIISETAMSLPGNKGYIRVTPLGNGVTTLDGKTVTGVYGLDAGDSVAKFDDPLYAELFNDRLDFSTDAEHNGYRPRYLNRNLTSEGMETEIGTGAWGVVTGLRFQFPKALKKGDNTTLVLNMNVSDSGYGQIRVYDYTGKQLGVLKLDKNNTGKFHEFEIDISSYNGTLEGVQLIFGPNSTFTSVNSGVKVIFKDVSLKNTYYSIRVNGKSMMCAGTRKLIPGYTTKDLVQFTTFFNFGVRRNDTPLGFSGTVLLDGKKLQSTGFQVVGYPNTDTICFKVPHGGKVLTIKKDSVIYYGGVAVKVEDTFNAKWNGSRWVPVGKIPAAPAAQYVTLSDGTVKKVENRVELQPGYTANGVVQFVNVYDFGVSASDTPLGFEGTVMLDGELVYDPLFVGYPANTTIALKAPHQNRVLTILKDSVIYFGDSAVVVDKTFNAKWNGSSWKAVSEVPEIPETQYVTLSDGTTRELMANVTLIPGFTMDNLIQFPDIYDFGAPADSTPIGFEGKVLLQGKEVNEPSFNAYLNSTTVGLEKLNHKGKVVTIMEGAIIYNDTAAVRVKSTFNGKWDGSSWTAVEDIPEPEAPEQGTLKLQYRYGSNNAIRLNTDLPESIPCANFLATDNGCNITQSGSQQVGWIGMEVVDGITTLAFNFNNAFTADQYYVLEKDSVFGFTDGSTFTLDKTYVFIWDGTDWTVTDTVPTPPDPVQTEVSFAYRWGNANTLQVNTNLPASTPISNFLATDNGSNLTQSGDQNVGWIGMADADGTIVLTFNFNSEFANGQYYKLAKGSVFGFSNGKTYELDKDYVFIWNGTDWTVTDTAPTPPEPVQTEVSLSYRWGNASALQVNTNLPASTPISNFLATDNGSNLTQSGDQNVGWIGMADADGTIVLTFNFNSEFSTNQYYKLDKGSVFGFSNGKTYELDKDYIFVFDGSAWSISETIPEPVQTEVSFQYNRGNSQMIGVATNLPASTPTADFLADANGCNITQSGDQQVGYIAMTKEGDVIGLGFVFNTPFTAGQYYKLDKGSVFGFTDNKTYELDKDYIFVWDGSAWSISETIPEPVQTEVSLSHRWGNANTLQVNTNLPASTPISNFLATDNGSNLSQSGDQNVGWIGMADADGTIVLTFNFGSEFSANQYYKLAKGSVFGFTDNKTYELDKDYIFVWDGSAWTLSETIPEPVQTEVSFVYNRGNSQMIGVATNLPATTPTADFLADANGCSITQSGDQQVGYIAMTKEGDVIGLGFVFNNAFEAGQYYKLDKGSVFGFTDNKTYELDKDYIFVWDGSAWSISETIPEPVQTEVSLSHRWGNANTLQVNTDLPATTPCASFLAGDNGSSLSQSGDQSVGWIGMVNADGTIVLTFNFNSAFETDQYYKLDKGSVFGFTDGKSYKLDKDYVFTWNGSEWKVTDAVPQDPKVNLSYRWGTASLIQMDTDLPAATPCANFLAGDNGSSLSQSGDQSVGWIGMDNSTGAIILTFNFNGNFTAGQTYTLAKGSVFGFTDGSTYKLSNTCTFTFDGSNWTMTKS